MEFLPSSFDTTFIKAFSLAFHDVGGTMEFLHRFVERNEGGLRGFFCRGGEVSAKTI